MPFDPKEKAVLTIRGQDYSEWETVQVKNALVSFPFLTFRLTCSEGQPIASNFKTMQIIPGDAATITLAGEPAFNGEVYSRQVFYDGTKHYIEIQGVSKVMRLNESHVANKTLEFNNKPPVQILTTLTQQEGIKFIEEMGKLPTTPIPNYNVAPGTTIAEACETIIRSCGDAQLKTNLNGDLVAVINPSDIQGTVREGVDILEGRELIYNGAIYKQTFSVGAKAGTDQEWGAKAAQLFAKSNVAGSSVNKGTQVAISEIPAFTKDTLLQRANMDRSFQNRDQVTIFITVQGWLRPGGGLWEVYPKKISVISPMLIMNGSEELNVKSVTFTQDNSTGTRTVIEACNRVAWAPGPIGGP